MPSAILRPEVLRLAGTFTVYASEYEDEGVLDHARRIRHPDGRIDFILEQHGRDERWELRLVSTDGRRFLGRMTSRDWDIGYPVAMQLWEAPGTEREWLLLGTWTDPTDGDIPWSITLFVDDDPDDERPS